MAAPFAILRGLARTSRGAGPGQVGCWIRRPTCVRRVGATVGLEVAGRASNDIARFAQGTIRRTANASVGSESERSFDLEPTSRARGMVDLIKPPMVDTHLHGPTRGHHKFTVASIVSRRAGRFSTDGMRAWKAPDPPWSPDPPQSLARPQWHQSNARPVPSRTDQGTRRACPPSRCCGASPAVSASPPG